MLLIGDTLYFIFRERLLGMADKYLLNYNTTMDRTSLPKLSLSTNRWQAKRKVFFMDWDSMG